MHPTLEKELQLNVGIFLENDIENKLNKIGIQEHFKDQQNFQGITFQN